MPATKAPLFTFLFPFMERTHSDIMPFELFFFGKIFTDCFQILILWIKITDLHVLWLTLSECCSISPVLGVIKKNHFPFLGSLHLPRDEGYQKVTCWM